MSSISTDSLPLVMLERPAVHRGRARRLRVRPFRELNLPRPKDSPSGLFPAIPMPPEPPPVGGALRLRRAVALTVVLGTVSLLAYASWQRVANAREPVEQVDPSAGHRSLARS
jgi:hypothetical protein